jgi:hypothetical protein
MIGVIMSDKRLDLRSFDCIGGNAKGGVTARLWHYLAPPGHTIEDMKNTKYFSSQKQTLKKNDIINVLFNDLPAMIEGLVVKGVNTDSDEVIVDELIDNGAEVDIEIERQERIAADEVLQGNIDDVDTAYKAADVVLQGNIDSEASTRESNDNQIISNYEAADVTLQGNIDSEATARASGDTTLQGNINSEAAARASADSILQQNISDYISQESAARATGDTTTLQSAKDYTDNKLTSALIFKGSVPTFADLPTGQKSVGDMYNVIEDDHNYAWDGSAWDKLGGTIDLSGYRTSAEQDLIDTDIKNEIGDLSTLTTDDKASAVNAINEVNAKEASNYEVIENILSTLSTIPTIPTDDGDYKLNVTEGVATWQLIE